VLYAVWFRVPRLGTTPLPPVHPSTTHDATP